MSNFRTYRKVFITGTLLVCGLIYGCDLSSAFLWPFVLPNNEFTPLISMQITETSNPVAFERVISELEAREIRCTILVDADFVERNCERIKTLADDGFEIMAFVRPEATAGEIVTMSMLSYEDQETLITEVKTAIENCLGQNITGFRCYRFDQNEDTYVIVDSLGFQFNLGFVAQTYSSLPGHQQDSLSYRVSDYGFWAVPMHSVYANGRWAAFCDMPFSSLGATEWESLLKSELDRMTSLQHPLLVEFHPYFSGADEGRFEAFVKFLDYAVGQNARFMTVAELVEWSE